MAKPLSLSLLTTSTLFPHNNSRQPVRRSRRPARCSSSKSATKVRAPSAGVLAALAALAAARPVDQAATPLTADVPDFLCPALVGVPSLAGAAPSAAASRSAGPSATPAAPHRAAETASAPAPSPQQQYLARSTSTPTYSNTVESGINQHDTHTVTDSNTSTNSDAVASRQSRSSKSVPNFSTRTRADDPKPRPKPTLRLKRDDTGGVNDSCSELYTSRTIPDRYELGNDGRWHKLSVWSSCTLCECVPEDVDDSSDNNISATGVSDDVSNDAEVSSSVSATTSYTASTSSSLGSTTTSLILPDGWDRKSSSTVYRVPLIVIASLLLAAGVTCAVWISVFWRRRRRIAKEAALAHDVEKRRKAEAEAEGSGSEESVDEDGDEDAETGGRRSRRQQEDVHGDHARQGQKGEEKAKARWARATAQWKAHVRWTHRRRRGRSGITDSTKQRDDATASGVSLARSVASSRVGSASRRRIAYDRSRLRGGEPEPEPETELEPTAGDRIRVGQRIEVAVGPSSEGHRSLRIQDQDEGEAECIRPRPRLDIPNILTTPPNRNPSTVDSDWSEMYDDPPPAMSPAEEREMDGEDEVQGPPAYRSRGIADDDEIRSRSRRVRRDEKRAAAPGYVPTPDDCAPYASSDEDEEDEEVRVGEDEGEGRSAIGRRSRNGNVRRVETNMHVAVDDKHALARLAAYASAPPPSSPPAPEISHMANASFGAPEANAPPEPEWLYDSAIVDAEDSPGAGPGPSTEFARSTSPSLPSEPPSSHLHLHTHTPFPAPPKPVSSQLAYAPLDAGLDPNLGMDLGFGVGVGLDNDLDLDLVDVPSAPPFSAYAEPFGIGGSLGEGSGNDVLAGASAPPLFSEDDSGDIVDASNGALADRDEAELGGGHVGSTMYAESEVPPGAAHVETADRNAVLSAVR